MYYEEDQVKSTSPSGVLIIILIILFIATVTFTILFVINFINFNDCKLTNNAFICNSVNCPYSSLCCPELYEKDCIGEFEGLQLCGTNDQMLPNDKNTISLNTCFYPYYESDIKDLNDSLKTKIESECKQTIGINNSKGLFAYAWKKDKKYNDFDPKNN